MTRARAEFRVIHAFLGGKDGQYPDGALHSVVHLTYNNVMHRLAMFAASNVVLAALWIVFFAHLVRGSP